MMNPACRKGSNAGQTGRHSNGNTNGLSEGKMRRRFGERQIPPRLFRAGLGARVLYERSAATFDAQSRHPQVFYDVRLDDPGSNPERSVQRPQRELRDKS
jgi:hypothetical protein